MQITPTPTGSGTGYLTSISIVAGESVPLGMTISSGGAPVNLTGYTLKSKINLPTPLLLNTTNGGITVTNAAQGAVQLNIASAVTAAMPIGSFAYDLWMVSGAGVETPLLSGSFTVGQNITPVP